MADQDVKYLGAVLRQHNAAGIARITINDLTNSTVVLSNKDVDLYMSEFNRSAAPPQYSLWCFWYEVSPASHTYEMKIELAPQTNTGRYIEFEYSLINAPLSDGGVGTLLTTWHSDYVETTHTYTLVADEITSLEKIQLFSGDGTTTDFVLPTTVHAHEFVMFRTSTGDEWKYPSDPTITWGSNGAAYDDSTIDSTGKFGISFDTAPANGSAISVRYIPMVNKYKLNRTMKQPYDSTTGYIDYCTEVRLLSDALELIP